MGKSIFHDLIRDNNFRYFFKFLTRLKYIGFLKLIKELKTYYNKYSTYPQKIGVEKEDLKYKLFVLYNYFKIIAVHPYISYEVLMNYFPTRLQKYFIFKLDPKDKRMITYDKILFYKELFNLGLPFPEVFFYKENDLFYNLNDNVNEFDINILPDKFFVKPIKDNGGGGARIYYRNEIKQIKNGFLAQQIAINNSSIVDLAGSFAFNTVRIISYIDNSGKIHILSAIMRLSKGQQVDNWGKGSINVGIDLKTGKLGVIGITKRRERYKIHPAGKFIFDGFILPYWDVLLDMVFKGAKGFDYLRLIAWDIGIGAHGPIIVEANAGCDFFHAQLFTPYGDTILIKDLLNAK